jgi:hypothetical protein
MSRFIETETMRMKSGKAYDYIMDHISVIERLGKPAEFYSELLSLPEHGFKNRLKRGLFAEEFFVTALEISGCLERPYEVLRPDTGIREDMLWEHKAPLIEKNAREGDLSLRFEKGPWLPVDVKMGPSIADDSLGRFSPDGYYMINALSLSKDFYFIVKNNDAFRDAIRKIDGRIEDGRKMFDVPFSRITESTYPGCDFKSLVIDPIKYKAVVWRFVLDLEKKLGFSSNDIFKLVKKFS